MSQVPLPPNTDAQEKGDIAGWLRRRAQGVGATITATFAGEIADYIESLQRRIVDLEAFGAPSVAVTPPKHETGRIDPESPSVQRYASQSGESVMGIALRQLGDEKYWRDIIACNPEFSQWGPHDYFPIGSIITLPAIESRATSSQRGRAT